MTRPSNRARIGSSAPAVCSIRMWLNFVATELHKPLGFLFKPDLPDGFRAVIEGALGSRLDYLEHHLDGREWSVGDRFGIADAYVFSILNWSGVLAIDLVSWPRVQAYLRRGAARPAVAAALRAEGLSAQAAA